MTTAAFWVVAATSVAVVLFMAGTSRFLAAAIVGLSRAPGARACGLASVSQRRRHGLAIMVTGMATILVGAVLSVVWPGPLATFLMLWATPGMTVGGAIEAGTDSEMPVRARSESVFSPVFSPVFSSWVASFGGVVPVGSSSEGALPVSAPAEALSCRRCRMGSCPHRRDDEARIASATTRARRPRRMRAPGHDSGGGLGPGAEVGMGLGAVGLGAGFAPGPAAGFFSGDPDGDDGLGNDNGGSSPTGKQTDRTLTQEDADRIFEEYQVEEDETTMWKLTGY